MPIKIQIAKLPEIAKRERLLISPQEKFNRLSRRLVIKGKRFQLRKFHFNVISSGKSIVVFDGNGIEAITTENSINGYRLARLHCLELFLNAKDQNGGFLFTMLNLENDDEIPASINITSPKDIEMKQCNFCTFYFEKDKIDLHVCAKTWMISNFTKIRKTYV